MRRLKVCVNVAISLVCIVILLIHVYVIYTKLLEQALVVEEQLHRAASLGLQHDPKLGIMQLHSR